MGDAISNGVIRDGLADKVTSEKKLVGMRKGPPGSRNSTCTGPEDTWPTCMKNKVSVGGWSRRNQEKGSGEMRSERWEGRSCRTI